MTRLLTEVWVADYTINSGRGQGYAAIVPMSREYCKKCKESESICKVI